MSRRIAVLTHSNTVEKYQHMSIYTYKINQSLSDYLNIEPYFVSSLSDQKFSEKTGRLCGYGSWWEDKRFSEEHKRNMSKNHADVSGDKNGRALRLMYKNKIYTTQIELCESTGLSKYLCRKMRKTGEIVGLPRQVQTEESTEI